MKTKSRNTESDIALTKALNTGLSRGFVLPKKSKLLLLETITPRNRLLPEDRHYKPKNLLKLFLRVNVTCLGRRRNQTPGTLMVNRCVGKCHQDGSDYLLTWHVFQKLKEVYVGDNNALMWQFAGVLFGWKAILQRARKKVIAFISIRVIIQFS
ncbi:probable CCR4-associated factor 1 homolog 9 [Capsicum annuum]|uniref:probable CCR4-associated factor 1 homolog 9 n=1 Tax=Capsicum annuum TaxID=4072 RepID=UPI001FB0A13A|nr:probable CCR4-associated factor 1 homolog 9 [Capsicum annuum]